MRLFIKKLSGFFLLLFILLAIPVAIFYYYDPFKVVHKYDSYLVSGKPQYVSLNFDYIGVENFLDHYPTQQYNSFIFGSSRSRFYRTEEWQKYIGPAKCYHLDASAESLFGIYKKLALLQQKKVSIKNALLIIDPTLLSITTNSTGHLFLKHPLLTGGSKWQFQLEYLKVFVSTKLLWSASDLAITGKFKPYMHKQKLFDETPIVYDNISNEIKLPVFDDPIRVDPLKFYDKTKMKVFYPRDTIQHYAKAVIGTTQLEQLKKIRDILKENGTNYKIIISPLYDQLKMNPVDLFSLQNIFGKAQVFDFSGINFITADYHNYYESDHYRPIIADTILHMIYSPSLKQ